MTLKLSQCGVNARTRVDSNVNKIWERQTEG